MNKKYQNVRNMGTELGIRYEGKLSGHQNALVERYLGIWNSAVAALGQ